MHFLDDRQIYILYNNYNYYIIYNIIITIFCRFSFYILSFCRFVVCRLSFVNELQTLSHQPVSMTHCRVKGARNMRDCKTFELIRPVGGIWVCGLVLLGEWQTVTFLRRK